MLSFRRLRVRSASSVAALAPLRRLASSSSAVGLLPHKVGRFNSIEISLAGAASDSSFADHLQFSVARWRESGVNAVWLTIPAGRGDAISAAAAQGFQFHHAEGDTCSMLLWLPKDRVCPIPPFATHQVGVAGVVLDDERRLLLVKDRSAGPKAQWKFPGGLTDLGEEIGEVAKREVKEETGIDASFSALLAFRHQHQMTWGRSDLYFLCLLRPTKQNQEIRIEDTNEISEACWMDAGKFIASTSHPMNKIVAELALSSARSSAAVDGAHHLQIMEESTVYIPVTKRTVKIYTAKGEISFPAASSSPPPPTSGELK